MDIPDGINLGQSWAWTGGPTIGDALRDAMKSAAQVRKRLARLRRLYGVDGDPYGWDAVPREAAYELSLVPVFDTGRKDR